MVYGLSSFDIKRELTPWFTIQAALWLLPCSQQTALATSASTAGRVPAPIAMLAKSVESEQAEENLAWAVRHDLP